MIDNKIKILIVEDEGIFAMDLKFILIRLGYEVTGSATNSLDTIAQVEKNMPDLVLMDLQIKGKFNGIVTAKYLKNTYNIPSLFITANNDTNVKQQILELSPLGMLTKPLDELKLSELLMKFRSGKRKLPIMELTAA